MDIKEGDNVIVDKEFRNGGYIAKVLWVGKYFAQIEYEGEQWGIMKNRLELVQNKNKEITT